MFGLIVDLCCGVLWLRLMVGKGLLTWFMRRIRCDGRRWKVGRRCGLILVIMVTFIILMLRLLIFVVLMRRLVWLVTLCVVTWCDCRLWLDLCLVVILCRVLFRVWWSLVLCRLVLWWRVW